MNFGPFQFAALKHEMEFMPDPIQEQRVGGKASQGGGTLLVCHARWPNRGYARSRMLRNPNGETRGARQEADSQKRRAIIAFPQSSNEILV